jgi:hypothetical protein
MRTDLTETRRNFRRYLDTALAIATIVGCGATATSADGGSAADSSGDNGSSADASRGDGSSADASRGDVSSADASLPVDPPDARPPHVVGDCRGLAAVGTWENITPPAVAAMLPPRGRGGPGTCTYGVSAVATDPSNPAIVYLGTCAMGFWKSTDCGATWTHINTGTHGADLDRGSNWTIAVDPVTPNVVYTSSGYGTNQGYRSTNGGVDWERFWPPADGSLAGAVDYDFVGQIVMDPSNHRHLLVSFHGECNAPYNVACIGETTDAGATWHIVNGDRSWAGGEGQFVYFLNDSRTWLWGSQTNGLWRTTDGGAHWTTVPVARLGHGAGGLYRATDGAFYLGANDLLRSPDGITWTVISVPSGGPIAGLIGDGTALYASRGYPWGGQNAPPPYAPFSTSAETDGRTWTRLAAPMMTNGGGLVYDPDHRILYSSNEEAGFWRVVVR